MTDDVDALSSPTLKNLRERWWDDAFTAFIKDTLQPRPGRRILDVGCGIGTAEVHLSRLRLTQVDLVAIDLAVARVALAHTAARSHNIRAAFAAADVCALPFADGSFDSTFTVAVLQHIGDVPRAVKEMARVTRPGGRIVAVEPDNAARFFYSSSPAGARAYEAARRFFDAHGRGRGDGTDAAIGPKVAPLFAQHGIEPIGVHVFPVSRALLGVTAPGTWERRRAAIRDAASQARDAASRTLADEYLARLDEYAAEAGRAGPRFVEIQNTMLFATVGERQDQA